MQLTIDFIRSGSPPDRVVAEFVPKSYPGPTSPVVCTLQAILGIAAKKSTASSKLSYPEFQQYFSHFITNFKESQVYVPWQTSQGQTSGRGASQS